MKIIQQKNKKHFSSKYTITICLILSAQIPGPVHTTEVDEDGCEYPLKEENYYTPCGTCLVAGGVGSVAVATAALPALGFTASGVALGSIAASIQSAFYGGATTGVFSTLHRETD